MKNALSLLITVLFFFCVGLSAGDFGGDAAQFEESVAATDAGPEAVYQAQVTPGVEYEDFKTAFDQIDEYAQSNNFDTTWDDEKKRMFIIQYAAFNTNDPSTDQAFLIKREMAAKQAVLRAKSDIIRSILSDMSAIDQIDVPDTPPYEKLNAKYAALQERIRDQQTRLVALLERVDAAEAKALDGVTLGDRLNSLLEAVIKRIDSEFDAGNIEAAHRERFEATKLQYAEAMVEFESMREQAEAIKGSTTASFSSGATVHAAMPLIGSTVIQQAESWDEESKQYEVAVLLCWSAELEKAARATLSGDITVADGRTGQKNINEWLAGQDLGAMVGPRQFLDDQGQRYFIGVTARPVVRNTNIDMRNRTAADMFASQMAVFSLFADVDSYTNAQQMAMIGSSDDPDSMANTDVEESIAERLTQSFQNLTVQGLMPILRKRVRHAITGQNMHVSVYGINPAAAAAAMRRERQNALSAIAVNQNQAFRAARSQALSDAVRASVGDAASRQAGEAVGRTEVGAAPQPQTAPVAAPVAPMPARRTTSRSVIGGDIQDDF